MNSTDTIITFDLHSVIFTPNFKEAVKILWQWPHKLRIITSAFKIGFVLKAFRLLFHDPTDEEFFALFQERCPVLLPLIIQLFNSFKPIDGTVDILKELKNKNYTLHIASNIGPRRFKTLSERFPEILNLFDAAKINNGDVKNLVKKPSQQFFTQYLQDYNKDNKKVIFIDDKKQNIEAAEKFGIVGICFKSPYQLRCAFKSLHIL